MLKEMVKLTVDALNLKAIVVYDVCGDNNAVDDIFAYAANQGIRVIVPRNSLKDRNVQKKKAAHAQQR